MTTIVNKDHALQWVEALESGEFPQDPNGGYLKTGNGYCCLGVLEEVAGGEWEENSDGIYTSNGRSAFQSQAANNWLGVDEFGAELQIDNPRPDAGNDPRVDLTYVNDSLKLPFPEIAALLREEFDLPPREA